MKAIIPEITDYIKIKKPELVKQDRRRQLTGLYAITDASVTETDKLVHQVEQALIGGARIIQFRNKKESANQRLQTCLALRKLTHRYNALLIVNDDVELTRTTQADGVHLGMDDMNPKQAREILGQDIIIGTSCYNRFDLAEQAVKVGADYIAFGSFFPSTTKPDAVRAKLEILKQAKLTLDVPVVAIGGINPENGRILIDASADMLAVVDGVFGQTDIEAAARRFCNVFR